MKARLRLASGGLRPGCGGRLSSCSRARDAAARGTSETQALSALAAPTAATPCAPTNFFIDAAPASCAAGSPCSVTLKLVATGDFHINDEYPYKFKADDAPGVAFLGTDPGGKNTFSKAAGDWQKTDAKSGVDDGEVHRGRPGSEGDRGHVEAQRLLGPDLSPRAAASDGDASLSASDPHGTPGRCYPGGHERAARRCVAGHLHRRAGRGTLPRRAGASCRSPSFSSSSTPNRCATRATRAATCATSSTTTARPTIVHPGASSRVSRSSICRGSRAAVERTKERSGRSPGRKGASSGPCREARSSARSRCRRRSTARSRISCARAAQPARAAPRPERLREVDDRVVHDGRRSSTTRRSTRARSTASTGCSRRRRRSAARWASRSEKSRGERGRSRTRTSPTRRSTPSSSSRCATIRSF